MSSDALRRCLPGSAVAVLLSGAAGCGMLDRPSARITGVNVEKISLTDATMRFDVTVDNPYTVPLPISNVDYALSSGGRRFLDGEADVQGSVPAGGSKTLGVPVRISYLGLINAVKSARPGATIPYKADLGLSVDAPTWGRLRVPMSREGELSIPSAPSLLERLRDAVK